VDGPFGAPFKENALLHLFNPPGLERALVGVFTGIAGLREMANAHDEAGSASCSGFCPCDEAEGMIYMLRTVAVALESAAMPFSSPTREALRLLKESGVPEINLTDQPVCSASIN
jgi:hypothetical protein